MKFIYRFVITSSLIGIIIWKMGGIRKVGELLAGMNLAYLLVITPMPKKFLPSHRINSVGPIRRSGAAIKYHVIWSSPAAG